jgi:hypothetical protein
MNNMSEEFRKVFVFFKGGIEDIGADLPSTWTLEGFTQLVLGEEEVFDPSYLSDVYSNLLECGFHSCLLLGECFRVYSFVLINNFI